MIEYRVLRQFGLYTTKPLPNFPAYGFLIPFGIFLDIYTLHNAVWCNFVSFISFPKKYAS